MKKMTELMIALIGFLGVILGVAIQEFRIWRERNEFYHSIIFKERLERHQKAFEWCHKLNVALNSHNADKINKIARDFRDWWDGNCFYLDEKSRDLIIPLINYAHLYARKETDSGKVWDYFNKALDSLPKGIGVKYLPEMRGDENDR